MVLTPMIIDDLMQVEGVYGLGDENPVTSKE